MTFEEKREILVMLYLSGEIDKEDFFELMKKIRK